MADLTAKELVNGLNENIEALKLQLQEKASGEDVASNSKELAVLKTQIEEKTADLQEVLKTQGAVLTGLEEAKKAQSNTIKAGSIEDQIREQIEASPEEFAKFKRKESNTFHLALKVAGDMTTANVSPDTVNVVSTGVEAGYVDILGISPLVESYCNVGNTNNATIQYVEKKNRDGSTIFIAEAGAKPQIDFDWVKNTSQAKKVASHIKVSDEMLDDIAFMASAIEGELRYQIDLEASEGILSGAGTGEFLKGITTYATAGYVLTTVLTTTPNVLDVIKACATQIKINNAQATHVFLNPIDAVNMGIAKGTTGYYVVIDGMVEILPYQVVESNMITAGDIVVGDMTKSIVRNYKAFAVEYGYENDDFTKNLVTIRGERRLHHWIPDNWVGAFVYDTISDIQTAITTP